MSAGKKPTPAAVSKEAVIDVGAVQKDFQTSHELALANAQHESAVRAMAERVGYQLEATDPDLIQRDVATYMRRSVEACMELGRGLCVLKTACGHGNFVARLGVLQLDVDLARRLMQAAVKFSNNAAPRLLKAANSQSKLLELLVLDDEQIEEFELLGESGELDLDDVATMSQKELRAKLREARQEKIAVEKVSAAKQKQIDKLQLVHAAPPDQQFDELMKRAASITRDAMGAIRGGVRAALIAIKNHGTDDNSVVMAGLVGQLQADLNALRDEFNLPDVSNAKDAQLAAEMAQWSK